MRAALSALVLASTESRRCISALQAALEALGHAWLVGDLW
jgi:hypothetical protein